MRISIQSDIASVTRRLTDVQSKHVPFASVLAITRTAFMVRQAEIAEISKVFDRPTPYTRGGVLVDRATKAKPYADVYLRHDRSRGTPPAAYLLAQVTGGQRALKRSERALQRIGAMPSGTIAVPGAGARLDAYGNMSRGQIVQILSFLRAFRPGGYRANRAAGDAKKRQKQYFAVPNGAPNLPPGVYSQVGKGRVIPVLMFIAPPQYEQRLRYGDVGRRTVRAHIGAEFRKALDGSLMQTRARRAA